MLPIVLIWSVLETEVVNTDLNLKPHVELFSIYTSVMQIHPL